MHFRLDLKQVVNCVAGLLLGFGASQVFAQTASQKIQVLPAEVWYWSESSGYKSFDELKDGWNAIQEETYRQCMKLPNNFCTKAIFEGIRPSPVFPRMVNGNYMYFDVNATRYDEDGGQFDASFNYGVGRHLQCPIDDGFLPETVLLGPNSYQTQCVKYEVPPMQCSTGKKSSFNDPSGGGKSAGSGSSGGAGNPIQLVYGVKTEEHLDYATADDLLTMDRRYLGQKSGWRMPGDVAVIDLHTQNASPDAFGRNFSFSQLTPSYVSVMRSVLLEFRLIRTTEHGEFLVINPDGTYTVYPADAAGDFPIDVSGERIEKLVTPTPEGAIWRRTSAYDVVEDYGSDGRIRKRTLRSGLSVTYQYSGEQLTQMQDSAGRRITFGYNPEGLLTRATLPDGQFITYSYLNGLLERVTYPDGSSRQYLYNEPAHVVGDPAPYSLTGTLDENGDRVGTYKYNAAKQAISTEGAGGVNKYTLQFGGSYTQITSPSGATHVQYFTNANGRMGVSSVNQPAGAGCSAASSAFTYDASGNVASRTDFSGQRTTYTYDLSRNLETSRIEAVGTAQARTISSQWHPSYRLPTKIAEPLRLTTNIYDASGNLLSQTEQATTDATGSQGFAALPTGTPRTTTYTYNATGKVLTTTDPNNRTTTYSYYADTAFTGVDPNAIGHTTGDLQSITNSVGHITSFTSYDKAGRVRQSVDAKGITTDTSYTPRGWVASTAVTPPGGTPRTTSYSYDAAGQLKVVTQPDGGTVTYSYDPAHRLIGIKDAKGNEVAYTLDNAGNRTAEQIKDPSGVLQRSISRSFDALNRLQQVSGAAQ